MLENRIHFVTRVLTVLVLGGAALTAHAQEDGSCTEDADCPEGNTCERGWILIDCPEGEPDCAAGEDSENGFCVPPPPEPLLCDSEGACPAPLNCDADNERGALCAFDVQPLCSDDDSECPAGFECVDNEQFGGCSECTDTEEGVECASVSCAEKGINSCAPKYVACADDSDCAADFTCREITDIDLQLGWDASVVGSMGCTSDAYTALNAGQVQGGDYDILYASTDGAPEVLADGNASDGNGGEPTTTGASDDADSDGSMGGSSGGCSVSGAGDSSRNGLFALGLIGLALTLVRRRARA